MASTIGGFFIGFGLCVLLASLGGSVVLVQYYGQAMQWRDDIEQMYSITHSPAYQSTMDALNTLSPCADQVADAVGWILGIGWLAGYLRQIPRAASSMREIHDSSESAYHTIPAFEAAPQYLLYGVGFGLFLTIIDVILVVRARKK